MPERPTSSPRASPGALMTAAGAAVDLGWLAPSPQLAAAPAGDASSSACLWSEEYWATKGAVTLAHRPHVEAATVTDSGT